MNDIVQIKTDETGLTKAADIEGASKALAVAEGLAVTCQEEAEQAGQFLKQCSAAEKALADRRLDITRPMDAAKKSVMDLFKGPADALAKARTVVKKKISDWTAEEERKLAEIRRKAEEKARKEAEAAQAKVEKYAEEGRADMAEKWAEKAEQAELSAPPPSAGPKVSGVSLRTTYTVEVTDIKAACAGVADGRIPVAAVQFKAGELNKLASAFKGEVDLPGCKVRVSKTVAG